MARVGAIFIIALLFGFSAVFAVRPQPSFHDSTPTKIHPEVEVEAEATGMEEGCDGAIDEECLMRRTLAAHLDYIYTQHHKP